MTTIGAYDEYPFGFTWVIDEAMARASHAIADGGRDHAGDAVLLAGRFDERIQVQWFCGTGNP